MSSLCLITIGHNGSVSPQDTMGPRPHWRLETHILGAGARQPPHYNAAPERPRPLRSHRKRQLEEKKLTLDWSSHWVHLVGCAAAEAIDEPWSSEQMRLGGIKGSRLTARPPSSSRGSHIDKRFTKGRGSRFAPAREV
jgi:hypothetical protein